MINYHYFEELASTQVYAKEHWREFEGTVCIYAGRQTGGIGTHGRKWHSPKGNVYATFICPIDEAQKHVCNLAQVMSLSIATVIEELKPVLKWPNDVMVKGKKIAGVLCEVVEGRALVGVGVNVNMEKEDAEIVEQPVTSVLLESGEKREVGEVVCRIGDQFLGDLMVYEEEGFVHFYDEYVKLMGYVGAPVVFGKERGFVKGLARDGRLVVQLPNGTESIISNGSISTQAG